MTKKTMSTEDALLIISEVITFYFEIRGNSNDDKTEKKWRNQILNAEDVINKALKKQQEAA
jgi:hypothetical protein